MPGTNAGTGQPLTARCAKCITKFENLILGRARRYGDPQPTGKRRYKPNRKGGPRIDTFWLYEYKCGDCGHVGWSRHTDIASRWMRLYDKSAPPHKQDAPA